MDDAERLLLENILTQVKEANAAISSTNKSLNSLVGQVGRMQGDILVLQQTQADVGSRLSEIETKHIVEASEQKGRDEIVGAVSPVAKKGLWLLLAALAGWVGKVLHISFTPGGK